MPETQKCVTFVTFVTFWHKCQRYCTVCTLWQIKHNCTVCNALTWISIKDICKYATPLIFFNVYCIFFGFRAFYPQIIQKFVLPLHRNSKSSHAHRTFIALPSHTRTRVTAMRRSSNAKARSKWFQMVPRPPRSPLWGGRWLQVRKIILVIL